MFRNKWFVALVVSMCINVDAFAQDSAGAKDDEALHIDTPTMLKTANVVIDFGHAVYLGDTLFALGDIKLLATDVREWNAKGQIVVIFHGDAAYLILNDETYNANRRS
jgi:hypothetical protein